MATKFYLPSSWSSTVTPAFSSVWSHVSGADRHGLRTSKPNSSYITRASTDGYSTAYNYLNRQYVSDEISAQTFVNGSVRGVMPMLESSTSMNAYISFVAWIMTGSGTNRGTLVSKVGSNAAAGTELQTAINNHYLPNSTACSSVTAQQGDRLVIELGIFPRNTTSTIYNAQFFYGCPSSDCLFNETDVSSWAPWIEFNTNFAFQAATFTEAVSDGVTEVDSFRSLQEWIEVWSDSWTGITSQTDIKSLWLFSETIYMGIVEESGEQTRTGSGTMEQAIRVYQSYVFPDTYKGFFAKAPQVIERVDLNYFKPDGEVRYGPYSDNMDAQHGAADIKNKKLFFVHPHAYPYLIEIDYEVFSYTNYIAVGSNYNMALDSLAIHPTSNYGYTVKQGNMFQWSDGAVVKRFKTDTLAWDGDIPLHTGDFQTQPIVLCSAIDSKGEYLYVLAHVGVSDPRVGRVIKIRLSDNAIVAETTYNGYNPASCALDDNGLYLYICSNTIPVRITKFNVQTMTEITFVDGTHIGDRNMRACALDSSGTFLYGTTYYSTANILKVRTSDMVIVDRLIGNASRRTYETCIIDKDDKYFYAGEDFDYISRVRLSDFTWVDDLYYSVDGGGFFASAMVFSAAFEKPSTTITETGTVTEWFTEMVLQSLITVLGTINDWIPQNIVAKIVVEAMGVLEVKHRAIQFRRQTAESVGVQDRSTRLRSMSRIAVEGVTISDVARRFRTIIQRAMDRLGIGDSTLCARTMSRPVVDTVSIVDKSGRVKSMFRGAVEAVTIKDNTVRKIATAIVKAVVEMVTISDVKRTKLITVLKKVVVEAMGVIDGVRRFRELNRSASDTVSIQDKGMGYKWTSIADAAIKNGVRIFTATGDVIKETATTTTRTMYATAAKAVMTAKATGRRFGAFVKDTIFRGGGG